MQTCCAGLSILMMTGGFITFVAGVTTYGNEIGIAGVILFGLVLVVPQRKQKTETTHESEEILHAEQQ